MDSEEPLHPLRRGVVLRRAVPPDSREACIVLRSSSSQVIRDAVEAAHGWVDNPPDVGLFHIPHEYLRRGIWRIATEEDAATVRALFVAHAQSYGPASTAWVASEGVTGPCLSPPVARASEARPPPAIEPVTSTASDDSTLNRTRRMTLGTGKTIEVDCQVTRDGRVLHAEVYGPGTYAADAGLTEDESAEVRQAVTEIASEAANGN